MLHLTLPAVMTVLSGDADDDAICPACEAGMRTDPRDILPVYAGDAAMAEETCSLCGRNLLALARDRAASLSAELQVEHLVTAQGLPAVRFVRRPPEQILQALKAAGWRWDPRERHWYDLTRSATLPPGIAAPPATRVVIARPPVIRRRADRPFSASVH